MAWGSVDRARATGAGSLRRPVPETGRHPRTGVPDGEWLGDPPNLPRPEGTGGRGSGGGSFSNGGQLQLAKRTPEASAGPRSPAMHSSKDPARAALTASMQPFLEAVDNYLTWTSNYGHQVEMDNQARITLPECVVIGEVRGYP